MGLLRLLLAVSVVVTHSGSIFGLQFVGGATAVQAFFIISGFYMGLILNEKYTESSSYFLFISNRMLRIFPIFLICLLISIFLGRALFTFELAPLPTPFDLGNTYYNLHQVFSDLDLFSLALTAFGNVGIFLRSEMIFITPDITSGNLLLVKNPAIQTFTLSSLQFVPQAWTLEHELMFYLLAPFVVRRSIGIIFIFFVASAFMRLGIQNAVLEYAPSMFNTVSYFFFPSQLVFFLGGALSYKVYSQFRPFISARTGLVLLVIVIAFTVFFFDLPGASGIKTKAYYALCMIALPFIFAATRGSKLDSQIGETSYPIYVCHVIVISILVASGVPAQMLGLASLIGSILFASLLIVLVSNHIERLRQRRVATFVAN